MKRNICLALAGLLGLLTACSKKDSGLKPVSVTVKLSIAAEMGEMAIPYKGAVITISNLTTGQSYKDSLTEEKDQATFSSVVPGSYDVAVHLQVSAEDYEAVTGIRADGSVFFSGSANAQSAVADQNTITVGLRTGSGEGNWVIKQIYYAGSDNKDGALFRDQFIELYNNSAEVLYADSLYICQVEGVNTAMEKIDLTEPYYLPTGQWDWTKSPGMADANANTDYIYADALFRIPGNGTTYPVQPGKSIIIAATAINHKAPYIGVNGKEITVRNPDLTVDLSHADFDVYMGDQPGVNPLASDMNTNKTHLAVILNSNRDLVLDNPGREAVLIFKSGADITTWGAFKTPDNLTSGKLRLQMPKSAMNIFDIVEIQPTEQTKRCPKRVSLDLDAGFNYVTNGSYSSQALIRKTQKTEGGRIVLQDTNNSSIDFVTIHADPSGNAFAQ
ncbi:DUF4876 domain-containing protein [Chitinophaga sp. XS-30]|uniref:DUF4876 domain-containing protein n=1 Tax=Chitinophaga sp. XS-30 TaxID=2604421 RepID=UPI0011DCB11E|nr:DUF4876 domain-containing protein [Chitinophaga sp. XS-30]QEH40852.1 DUF4876 domain-containing protein [Chitinophaga sp. XS-30]